ncbi:hypothetical protein [Carboxylicivirga taeanensis]|uniref:hypothetical protein n=1 Tax=Carboxylicivirga taeanensis TaxID=1416875 RepID=UPI003F6E0041
MKKDIEIQGIFEAIDSFAVRRMNQFFVIGNLVEGTIEPDWFVSIKFNDSISMTLRINSIEEIEFTSRQDKYKLLVTDCDNETIDFLLGLNLGLEKLEVTIEGED